MPNQLWFDDLVILFFAVSGMFGGLAVHLRTKAKPIVVAIFLATGIAALVFRFLGGIEDSTLTIKSLKLGGTMAALIGSALAINVRLEAQGKPVPGLDQMKPSDFIGRWKWQWAEGGWLGYIDFASSSDDTLTFVGYMQEFTHESWKRIFVMDEGFARLVGRDRTHWS
jgi:hypothetical protein